MPPVTREEAYRELEAIYADLDQELGRLGPVCGRSGRCCRFREHGHELWTTRLEWEYLVDRAGPPPAGPEGSCPYLQGGLCGVRDHRMLGCRIYFCDPSYAGAMGPLYERCHRRIRDLHVRAELPYRYSELLSTLERK
jgi:hypothetical protein